MYKTTCFWVKNNLIRNQETASLVVDYLISISKTKNFALVKKFLKKTDKEGKIFIYKDLKILFADLKKQYNELVFSLDLEKLYL